MTRKTIGLKGPAPTVADVASLAGVSQMTVSRAINSRPGMSQETREKVLKAVKALGYVPNPAARSLAGRKQCRILILHSNTSPGYLSEILVGSIKGAEEASARIVVECWNEGDCSEDLVRRQANRVDAVLLAPPLCDDAGLIAALKANGLPIAQVATGRPSLDAQTVSIDDDRAAYQLTMYLVLLGHRRIGFIVGDLNQSASHLRLAGYKRALRHAGLELDDGLIAQGSFTYRSGLGASESLINTLPRPTAIFASNDDMAAAAIAVAHHHHLEVPADISVCGFDDSAIASSAWPEITTIRQPIAEMARRAIELLTDAVRNPKSEAHERRHLQLEFELVERGSTSPLSKLG